MTPLAWWGVALMSPLLLLLVVLLVRGLWDAVQDARRSGDWTPLLIAVLTPLTLGGAMLFAVGYKP